MKATIPIKIKPVLDSIQNELNSIFGQNLKQLILFGSYARATDELGSDIDILMVLREIENQAGIREQYRDIISDMSLEHDTVISIIIISEEEFENRKSPLILNIRKEGIKL